MLLEWPVDAEQIYIDPLDNVYLKSRLNELVKLNGKGNPTFRFQDQKLGNLNLVDVSNPFNVLLYYPEFQVIVILDRTLNETGRIQLSAFGLFDVEAVGMSSDNQFWIFDELVGSLKKISSSGKVLTESQPIPGLLGMPIEPVKIMEFDQQVYVQCVSAGLLLFDAFGQFREQIAWPQDREIQLASSEYIIGCKEANCKMYLPDLATEYQYPLPFENKKFSIIRISAQGRIYTLQPGKLQVYGFE